MAEEIEQFELPPGVENALRDAYTYRVEIPPSLDHAVLSAAQVKFSQRRRLRLMARWGTGLAAGIAATVVIVVSLHRPSASRPVAKGDINADGQVNIVDALSLAKHLAGKDKTEKSWDINGDGVVDQKDVDALAQAAVSLKQGVARRSLPTMRELGIDPPPVGLASASGISPSPGTPGEGRGEGLFRHNAHTLSLAEASPTTNATEARR